MCPPGEEDVVVVQKKGCAECRKSRQEAKIAVWPGVGVRPVAGSGVICKVAELLARSEDGSVSRNGRLNQTEKVNLQGCRTAGQIRDGSDSRNSSLNQKVKG